MRTRACWHDLTQSAAAKCATWSACAFTKDGRRGARNMVTPGRMHRQPFEPIDKAQHIRHEYGRTARPDITHNFFVATWCIITTINRMNLK
jgi:hypothetical protein